ncbi:hypothetical protein PODOV073v1_p0030 [Vibrio phage PS25B.1]|nr:hypothetical protein PODOV073v1_p0030 [Vibrio phage PS25B.1]
MSTTRANLDVTQYVRITSEPFTPSSLLLQSHRDTVRIAFSDVKPARDNTVFHELGGDNEPLNVSMTEVAVWALAMTDRAALTVTEQRVPVEVSDRGSMGQSVFVNDQTSPALDVLFLERLNQTTIAADTVIDTYTFTASPGHGIVVGNTIEIANTTLFIQANVLAVNGDVITIDSLINHVYAAGSVLVISNSDMLVDGSVTPRIFSVSPGPDQKGDIVRIIIAIQSTSSMDFSKFGSSPPLTRGCLLRVKKPTGDYVNLFNWKTNGGFIIRSFDHSFQEKVGGGLHSFTSRSTYGGQSKRGVVIRLDGGEGVVPTEELQIVIQDDLSTGLAEFLALAQGHELQE